MNRRQRRLTGIQLCAAIQMLDRDLPPSLSMGELDALLEQLTAQWALYRDAIHDHHQTRLNRKGP